MYSGIQYNTTYYPQPHMRHLFPKASYDSNTKYEKYDHNKLYGEYDTNRDRRRSSSDQYSDGDVRNFIEFKILEPVHFILFRNIVNV